MMTNCVLVSITLEASFTRRKNLTWIRERMVLKNLHKITQEITGNNKGTYSSRRVI